MPTRGSRLDAYEDTVGLPYSSQNPFPPYGGPGGIYIPIEGITSLHTFDNDKLLTEAKKLENQVQISILLSDFRVIRNEYRQF